MGLPAVFIRLGGCIEPYCPWCDTAWALHGFSPMEVGCICSQVEEYVCKRVVITGGEPFIQWETGLDDLHSRLKGYNIQYETSGKVLIPRMDDAMVVCSPKFIQGQWIFDLRNMDENMQRVDIFKFLAGTVEDLDRIQGFIHLHHIPGEKISIMPMGSTKDEQLMRMEMVFDFCRDNRYAMSPRLHTLIFDNKRGV
ncbi:MAG: 7-carboxy-7-deazaguanine synthase QueE [Thermodesulfobacteriota bacterium]|nr:7-carboxy-7-deazaguanine synthase QueE [Thermodesulfobacteriota bacterium]